MKLKQLFPLAILVFNAFSREMTSLKTTGQPTHKNNIQKRMVFVKGGTFLMGSNNGENDEQPVHSVTIDDFYIGKYEVTHKEYLEFLNVNDIDSNGSFNGQEYIDMDDDDCAIGNENGKFYFKGSHYTDGLNCPAIEVTWYGASAYCKWKGGRLPTEAEWEFASRGGIKSRGYEYSGSNRIGKVSWNSTNSRKKIHIVGTKQPNELGIYDMSGNVWEWCKDWYNENYYKNSSSRNPPERTSAAVRVGRGGSWGSVSSNMRSSNRHFYPPSLSSDFIGFRVVFPR